MEIKSGQLANQYQQNLKTQPKPEKKSDATVTSVASSSDVLSISPEAMALFGEGGGHPDRTKEK